MYSKLIYERFLNIQLSTVTALFKQHTKLLHSSNKITYKSMYIKTNHKKKKILFCHMVTPGRRSDFQHRLCPHTGHVTTVYIIYTKAGTHLPT
jgi:hypothetical protein